MFHVNKPSWFSKFDDRQQKEILFSQDYATNFRHGTDGHNAKLIIAEMANQLNKVTVQNPNEGMLFSDIAASAYRAYGANRDWKDWQGNPMPQWDELPEYIRTAWEAATHQVADVITGGSYGLDIESKWAGWTPDAS